MTPSSDIDVEAVRKRIYKYLRNKDVYYHWIEDGILVEDEWS